MIFQSPPPLSLPNKSTDMKKIIALIIYIILFQKIGFSQNVEIRIDSIYAEEAQSIEVGFYAGSEFDEVAHFQFSLHYIKKFIY